MSEHKMFITTKHCRGLTPEAIDLFRYYPEFYAKVGRAKLDEYHRQIQESKDKPDEDLLASVERGIEQAEALSKAFSQLAGELRNIFSWHFERLAQVLRTARQEAGYKRIEDSPELYRVTVLLMDMLKAENPLFSREKFINYINYEEETI